MMPAAPDKLRQAINASLRSHGTTTPQKAGTYDDLPTLQYTL
jgi:hypothetical protein